METTVSGKLGAGKAKRVFLRIPVELPAKIIVAGNPDKEVRIDELSTTGLSFYLKESEQVPNLFAASFRLSPFSRIIKITAEAKSRNSISGGLRIGCRFLEISEEDKRLVTSYICGFTNVSLPLKVVGVAAFLYSLDSLLRIIAYLLYYEGVKFENSLKVSFIDNFYLFILLLYAVCSFTTFILSGRLNNKKEMARFVTGTLCLIPAFIFIIIKDIAYWKFWVWHSEYFLLGLLFWAYVSFAFYTALSIMIGLLSLKKINLVLGVLSQHITSLAEEGVAA